MLSHFLRKFWPSGWHVPHARARTLGTTGRRWCLTPDADAVLGPDGPNLERWVAMGAAEVVKTGPHRTVYRVSLPGGTVYVKHCRISGIRAWVREVLRPAKARLEFENALALAERGVPAVLPLAWGGPDSHWPGESFLVTRSRDGVVPFVHFTEHVLPDLHPVARDAARRQLARALGQFLARLHDAGVIHPDPHPGNLLVELPPSHVPRFYLIDLHDVRVSCPLSWTESRANLILFNRWFQLRVSRTDRARFWHSYRRSRQFLPLPAPERWADQAREVERGTAASNLRFWAGRVSRCLGRNRHFKAVSANTVSGYAVRDLPGEFLAELLADPAAALARPGGRRLKDSPTSTVAEFVIQTAEGPKAVVLKRVLLRRWLDTLKNLLRRSPALRSWVAGHALRDRWLPTPRPLAVLHQSRWGFPAEGFLLTEKVPNPIGLPEAVASLQKLLPRDRERRFRVWSARIARMVRTMHDRAISHRDLKAPNVILEGAATHPDCATPVLIDLVGVRVGRAVPFRQRAKELARLNASFLNSRLVTRTDRLRFLRMYLGAGEELGMGGWRVWWAAIREATAAKIAKNQRTGRPLG